MDRCKKKRRRGALIPRGTIAILGLLLLVVPFVCFCVCYCCFVITNIGQLGAINQLLDAVLDKIGRKYAWKYPWKYHGKTFVIPMILNYLKPP